MAIPGWGHSSATWREAGHYSIGYNEHEETSLARWRHHRLRPSRIADMQWCNDPLHIFWFIMRLSYGPHYVSCPFICPIRAPNLKIKNMEKSKLALTFSVAQVSGVPVSVEKVKVQGRRTSKSSTVWCHVYLQRRIWRQLQTRSTPFLGLIYCRSLNMRHSGTGRTAASHVGTRRLHAFLFCINIPHFYSVLQNVH